MPNIWAYIVGAILLLIVYGIVSSKIDARKQRQLREKMLPFIDLTLDADVRYDLSLSDGRRFKSVRMLGTTDPEMRMHPFGEWGGMLVLELLSGKRAFIRPCSVRCIEEV